MSLVRADRKSVIQLMGRVEISDRVSKDGKWRFIRVYTGNPEGADDTEGYRWDVKVGDENGSWVKGMIDNFGKPDKSGRMWLEGEYVVTATMKQFLTRNENYVVAKGKKKSDGSDLAEHPYQLSLSLSCSPYGVEKVQAHELRTAATGSLSVGV